MGISWILMILFFFANNIVINGVVKILAAGLRHGWFSSLEVGSWSWITSIFFMFFSPPTRNLSKLPPRTKKSVNPWVVHSSGLDFKPSNRGTPLGDHARIPGGTVAFRQEEQRESGVPDAEWDSRHHPGNGDCTTLHSTILGERQWKIPYPDVLWWFPQIVINGYWNGTPPIKQPRVY